MSDTMLSLEEIVQHRYPVLGIDTDHPCDRCGGDTATVARQYALLCADCHDDLKASDSGFLVLDALDSRLRDWYGFAVAMHRKLYPDEYETES